jgi:hypothetical protein
MVSTYESVRRHNLTFWILFTFWIYATFEITVKCKSSYWTRQATRTQQSTNGSQFCQHKNGANFKYQKFGPFALVSAWAGQQLLGYCSTYCLASQNRVTEATGSLYPHIRERCAAVLITLSASLMQGNVEGERKILVWNVYWLLVVAHLLYINSQTIRSITVTL